MYIVEDIKQLLFRKKKKIKRFPEIEMFRHEHPTQAEENEPKAG